MITRRKLTNGYTSQTCNLCKGVMYTAGRIDTVVHDCVQEGRFTVRGSWKHDIV